MTVILGVVHSQTCQLQKGRACGKPGAQKTCPPWANTKRLVPASGEGYRSLPLCKVCCYHCWMGRGIWVWTGSLWLLKNEVSFPLLQDDWTGMTKLQQWELPSVCRCADVLLAGPRVAQKSDLTSRAECSIWVTYPFLIQEIPKCLTYVFILKSKIVKFLIG